MFDLFESCFWEIAIAAVSFIVPIIALAILFKIVGDLLWK